MKPFIGAIMPNEGEEPIIGHNHIKPDILTVVAYKRYSGFRFANTKIDIELSIEYPVDYVGRDSDLLYQTPGGVRYEKKS